jgi:hypothetical protein
MIKLTQIILLLLFSTIVTNLCALTVNGKKLMGIYENVVIIPIQKELTAKLDTGAKMNSIHGSNVKIYRENGKKWVEFTYDWPGDNSAEAIKIKRILMGYTKIKQKNSPDEKRPIVKLSFCMNGKLYKEKFNIANRNNFDTPILLGRDFFSERAVVDSEIKYTTSTDECKKYMENQKQIDIDKNKT